MGVSTNCAADIDAMCAEQKSKLRGNATVLRCLVDDYRKTSDPCQVRSAARPAWTSDLLCCAAHQAELCRDGSGVRPV